MLRIWGRISSIYVRKVAWCAQELGLAFDPRRYYRVTATREMSADDLRRAQDDVIERAVRLGPSASGAPRIDWTNFDVQPDAFGAPVLPSAR